MPPPFHTVQVNSASDRKITIYLDVVIDVHPTNKIDFNVFEKLLVQIAEDWQPIVTASNLKLTFVAGEHTEVPHKDLMPSEVVLEDEATPNDRILYREFDETNDPPNDKFFKLKVGNGTTANRQTRSTRISYVEYKNGKGYIYVIENAVPHISHELGHILGLTDRYYEGMLWYDDDAIQRNCIQIRTGSWFDQQGHDMRFRVAGNTTATQALPRYAERLTLVMHKDGIPADSGYKPDSNLMSSSSPELTSYQLEFIGIKNGQAITPKEEPDVRTTRWVAILGAADYGGPGTPQMKAFHVWDGGDALLFYPDNKKENGVKSYPCYSREKGMGKEKVGMIKEVVGPDLLQKAKRKKRNWRLINLNSQKKHESTPGASGLGLFERDKWCYCVRLLKDLE